MNITSWRSTLGASEMRGSFTMVGRFNNALGAQVLSVKGRTMFPSSLRFVLPLFFAALVYSAIVGAGLGLLVGLCMTRLGHRAFTTWPHDAGLGALGFTVGSLGIAMLPFGETVVHKTSPSGGFMTGVSRGYPHPEVGGLVLAMICVVAFEVYQRKHTT